MSLNIYQIDQFRVVPPDREGGMSVVRKAEILESAVVCALKFPKKSSDDSVAKLSMAREQESLSRLDHPNIVRLFGIGHDGADRFLVLEWLEESLSDRITAIGALDWAMFYESVGRPILDAMAYAHGRDCVHRDLKPSNIMFTEQSVPKVTDFGISRAMDSIHLGKTFMAAGSQPWTPPEQDDGIYSESRDAYSWAAICIACLTGRQDFRLADDLRKAADKLGESAPLSILKRCLSELPSSRPQSSKQLLWDLDDYHKARLVSSTPKIIGVDLSSQVHQRLETLLSEESTPSSRVSILLNDFQIYCEVLRLPAGDLEFSGRTLRMRCAKPVDGMPWLIAKDVFPASPLYEYGHSVAIPIQFIERRVANSSDLNSLRASISFVSSFLTEAVARAEAEQQARDLERYLIMQMEILAARIRALRDLPAIEYIKGRWEASDFQVQIVDDLLPEVGEQRIVRSSEGILVFEVIRVVAETATLRPVGPTRFQAPSEGKLLVDTAAQRRALERQEQAVKSLRAGEAVMPELKRVLLSPADADSPELGGRPPSTDLSADKQTVLDAALGLRQLMVVRGPPGTGKTTLITALVTRFLDENPRGRVLIAAQTHIGIDHVVEKLLRVDVIADRVVRIARTDEEKLSEAVKPALLHKRVSTWCRQAASRSRQAASARGAALGLNAAEVELSVRLEILAVASERLESVSLTLKSGEANLQDAQQNIGRDSVDDLVRVESATIAARSVADLRTEMRTLEQRIARLRSELLELGPDGAALAELPGGELRGWLSVLEQKNPAWVAFRRELEVQISWLDVLGALKRIEGLVLRSASVVAGTCVGLSGSDAFATSKFDLCIIDEASKATATEALIPMVRASRCLLVGDPEQLPPFDYGSVELDGYGENEIKETLLDYLIARLPESCIFSLTHQHRMCKSIGDLIGEVFYNAQLVNTRPDAERAGWIRMLFPRPVAWIDTKGHFQRKLGHTFVNQGEQDAVLELLIKLNRAAERTGGKASVAVIAGYAGQALALDSRIQRGLFPNLSVEVATVDSFQGKEADIGIYSVTLSNSNDYLGFLRSAQRLNVALSRSRDLLLIVGNQDFCYQVGGKNPFAKIIDFIEGHPDSCETKNARK